MIFLNTVKNVFKKLNRLIQETGKTKKQVSRQLQHAQNCRVTQDKISQRQSEKPGFT